MTHAATLGSPAPTGRTAFTIRTSKPLGVAASGRVATALLVMVVIVLAATMLVLPLPFRASPPWPAEPPGPMPAPVPARVLADAGR